MVKPKNTPKSPSSEATESHAPTARERLDQELQTLPLGEVAKIPARALRRLDHLGKLAAAATRDASMLGRVPLADGALQPWELEVFPLAVEATSKAGAEVGADRLSGRELPHDDKRLLARVRDDQRLLISAFRRLRFRGRSSDLKRLRAIEAGDPGDVVDARNDSTALLALAEHDDHRAWIASLPLGEAEAVARLKAAQPRLEALAKAAQDDAGMMARREELRRLWTILQRIERRVRAAGVYLFHGKAERADYSAYKPPARRKRKPPTE